MRAQLINREILRQSEGETRPCFTGTLFNKTSNPVLGYTIYYNEIPGNISSVNVSDTVLQKEISGLKKFTLYAVRILAFTPTGNGLPSIRYTVTTGEDGEFLTIPIYF